MAIKSVLGSDVTLSDRTDEELVDLARSGGSRTGAWDELYRRHASAARSVARHILRTRHDADDVVNEAFAGVISAIGHGAGPRDNFRQYLMACVRNGCKKRAWRGSTSISTDPSVLEQRHGAVFEDAEQFGEAGLVASAFSSLSTDWQRALWLTAVEERPTEDVARELGRKPAAVAALAHRAREAFAEAYLAQHQRRVTSPACERITPKLAHYVRGRSGDVDRARVEHHLAGCGDCTRAVSELRDVNSSLRTLALPTSLVGAGIVAASVAPVVGLGAAATVGGWAASILGGFTFAKAALIAALLVPAAVIATEASHSPEKIIVDAAGSADRTADASNDDVLLAALVSSGTASSAGSADGSSDQGLADDTGSAETTHVAIEPVGEPPVPSTSGDGGPTTTIAGSVAIPPAGSNPATPPPGGTLSSAIPAVDVPAVIVPSVVVPSIVVPPIPLTPPITVPAVTVPSLQLPGLTVPPATLLPSISVPSVSTPLVTTPPLQLPPVTLPAVSTPPISTPVIPVTPPISLPGLAVPAIVVPEVTLPPLIGLLGS